MGYETSGYCGDDVYSVCCTGDVVVGDEISFDRATFAGNFRSAKFAGFERITGKVVRDSYGRAKQQHTFSIEIKKTDALSGQEYNHTIKIKGRNVYSNGCWRKPWADERQRKIALDEKHARGDSARRARFARIEDKVYY